MSTIVCAQPMPMVPQTPIVKFFSPEKSDQGLIELHDTTTPAYQPLDLSAVHQNTRDYAGFKLLKQFNLPNDHKWLIRIWGKDTTNPQWFNYSIKYLAESASAPIFIRQYRELRKTYAPRTKLQPLKSVYQLKLATGGAGYVVGSFPAVTGSGGGGSGLTGYGIVAPDGTLSDLILESGGDSYTGAPTVTVADPPAGGTTATGTALLQSATALLVTEQADEFPDDSEFNGLYLNVTRVYQTIPGPWIYDTLIDPDGVTVTVAKRRNVANGVTPSETLIGGVWTETTNTGGDAVVSDEVVKSRAIPGNSMTIKKTDPDGVTVTVKRTLKAQSAITPSESIIAGILTKVSQEDPPVFRGFALRSGDLVAWEVVETRAVPGNVLSNQSLGQPNLTPEKYRRLVRSVETNQTVAPDYSFPSGLTGDQTQVRLQQETIAQARLQTISEVIAIGADPLAGGDTSEWGALSVYESVVNEGTPIETGFLVLNSKVTPFGNGKAVKITVKYSLDIALKHLLTRSLGQDNLTPAKYRRLVQHKETDSLVDPASYSFPSGLSGDQTEVRYIEETIFRARQKTIEEVVAIGADPLLGGETNEFGSLSIGESIVNDGSPIDTGYLVLKSTVTPFGNGKSVKITVSYPINLALQSILKQSIGQDNLTPAKYRRLVKHVETDSLVDLSTYTFPSGLSGDQTEVKSIQETIARARQTIISEIIAVGADPLAGQETGEWGIESISESIVNDGSAADSGYLVKTSRVTPLGNGKSIKITANYASTLATKQHLGQDLDRKFNIPIPYTDTIIAAGAGIGDASSEVTPIDDYRSRKRAVDVSAVTAVFEAYSVVMPGRTRIEFPQVLQTLDFSIEEHTGSGDAATDSVSGSWSGSGSIVIPSHAEAQFSRAVMPVLIGVFAPERGSHRYLPTKKVTFLLPAPVTETAVLTRLTAILGVSVTDWPNFNPQEIVAKLVGRQGSARVTADNHFQDGGSSTSSETAHVKSKGHSIDAGLTVKETRIRPSIHGAFTLVTTFTPFSQTITATASIVSDTETSTQTITGIDPSFAIYNVGATTGDTTIPTTGVRLLRTESELYQYGYIMIQAEVLDFADV